MRQKFSYGEVSAVHKFKHEETGNIWITRKLKKE